MPAFLEKIKSTLTGKKHEKQPSQSQGQSQAPAQPQTQAQKEPQQQPEQQPQEPTYSIQPHPATTNNPSDLEPPQLGGGLNSNPEWEAFNTPGPFIPSKQMAEGLPPPKSKDELQARSQELNRDENQ